MKKETIGVIDYDAGNLKSVETALRYLEADFVISGEPAVLSKTSRVIFPGVGDANAAMQVLKTRGLDKMLQETFQAGKPILGICLGTQIVFSASEERNTQCLDLVPGKVVRFPVRKGYKIPHMGWNQVKIVREHPLFSGIADNSSFYFVHSYYPVPENRDYVIGETDYGFVFTSAIECRNLVAVQFHPEKSGETGLKMLKNFLSWQVQED